MFRPRPGRGSSGVTTAASEWPSASPSPSPPAFCRGVVDPVPRGSASTLADRVFRKDLLNPLEGFLSRRLRGHPALDDIQPAGGPDMLGLDLRIGRVEQPEL